MTAMAGGGKLYAGEIGLLTHKYVRMTYEGSHWLNCVLWRARRSPGQKQTWKAGRGTPYTKSFDNLKKGYTTSKTWRLDLLHSTG